MISSKMYANVSRAWFLNYGLSSNAPVDLDLLMVGSRYFTHAELGDTKFLNSTELHGTAAGAITSSIMDYVPLNLHANASQRGGIYYSLNPGKYDHAAIEYIQRLPPTYLPTL